jgi:hypothetical protein
MGDIGWLPWHGIGSPAPGDAHIAAIFRVEEQGGRNDND